MTEKNSVCLGVAREPAHPETFLQAASGPKRHFSLVKILLWAHVRRQMICWLPEGRLWIICD